MFAGLHAAVPLGGVLQGQHLMNDGPDRPARHGIPETGQKGLGEFGLLG